MVAFNLKKVVQKVTDGILEKTGLPVEIRGDVDLKPGFSPKITATDLYFGESYVKKIVIALDFARLVKGEIRVKHLLLEESRIVIQRDENGRWIPDFRRNQSRETERGPGEKDPAAESGSKEVIMKNSRVLYMDRKTRTGLDVKAEQLKASAGARTGRSWVVDGVSRRMEITSFDTGTDDEPVPMAEPAIPEIPDHISLPGRADIDVRLDIAELVLNGIGLRRFRSKLTIRDGKPDGTVEFADKHAGIEAIMALLSQKPLQGKNLCASVRKALGEAADDTR
ncbi:MAG: hypothetical protein K9J83_00120 [Desulfarculaceae bacterium]|nr:hypothetical protein [Desulfarculaceae bacterium]